MTTAVLLGSWLALTVGAVPVTPYVAAAAMRIESWLGLDKSVGKSEE